MRLASFRRNGTASWGAHVEGGMLDLGARLPHIKSLKQALSGEGLELARQEIDAASMADYTLDALTFEPVIPDPGQILCIGLNFHEHRIETKRERLGYPTVFARFAGSQVGHEGAILRPPESERLDFEGEVAIVIGRTCRRVREDEALSYVAGYACYNDGSIRDFQKHTTQFLPGKTWPATGGFGPWLVTADEIPDPTQLEITTRLNGEVVQTGRLDQLIFSIPELIAYCSTWTELNPGDVIVTGTPGGVGSARVPPLWMKHGDVVEVDVPGVGLLINPIRDEQGQESASQPSNAKTVAHVGD